MLLCENGGSVPQAESDLTYLVDQKNGDRMITQLLNMVIAKYPDLSVPHRSIICLSLQLRQNNNNNNVDLPTTDKSRHFVQPHSIIVNYCVSFEMVSAQHSSNNGKNPKLPKNPLSMIIF